MKTFAISLVLVLTFVTNSITERPMCTTAQLDAETADEVLCNIFGCDEINPSSDGSPTIKNK